MVSASAWRRPAAARWWPGGVRRAASACRHEIVAGSDGWPHGQGTGEGRSRQPTPRVMTLKRRAEFQRVRKGARWATPAFVLEAKQRSRNEASARHAGQSRGSASPSPGRSARRSSAIASGGASRRRSGMLHRSTPRRDFDYVLIARRPALTSAFGALVSDLVKALDACTGRASRAQRGTRRDAGAADGNRQRIPRRSCRPGQPEEPPARHRAVGGRAAGLADVLCRPEAEGGAGAPAAHPAGADARPRSSRARRRLRPAARRRARCRSRAARPPRPACRRGARRHARGGAAGQPARARSRRRASGSIALKGGRIDDLVLVKYRETVDPKSPNVVLFSPSGRAASLLRRVRLGGGHRRRRSPCPAATRSGGWRSGGPLTPAAPVTLVWDNGQGLVFRRTIAVDADYLFTVTDEVENKTAGEVTLLPLRADLAPRHAEDARASTSCTRA